MGPPINSTTRTKPNAFPSSLSTVLQKRNTTGSRTRLQHSTVPGTKHSESKKIPRDIDWGGGPHSRVSSMALPQRRFLCAFVHGKCLEERLLMELSYEDYPISNLSTQYIWNLQYAWPVRCPVESPD